MSELLKDSTKQKLVLSSEDAASASAGKNENAAETPDLSGASNAKTDNTGEPSASPNQVAVNNNNNTDSGANYEHVDLFENHLEGTAPPNPNLYSSQHLLDAASAEGERAYDEPPPKKKSFWTQLFAKKTPGERRHQQVVASCVAFSIAVLGFSTIDVRALTEQTGSLDNHFKFIPDSEAKRDLLASNRFEDPLSVENVRRVRSNSYSNMGYADNAGNFIVPANYSETLEFTEGLGAMKPGKAFNGKDYSNKTYIYVDAKGKTVLDKDFDDATPFHNGVASVVIKGEGKLIDKNGNILGSTGSGSAAQRHGNTWEVTGDNGKYGLLGANGKQVLAPIYDKIEPFIAENANDGYPSQIDNKQPDAANARYFKITENGLRGVIDANGKILIEPKYADIAAFNKGYATFKQNDKFGYVNAAGDILVKPTYYYLTAYDTISAGKTVTGGDWQVLNAKGEILPFKFDGAATPMNKSWIKGGRAPFIKDKKYGFLDRFGNVAINPTYDFATDFSNGYSTVSLNNFWHYIDKQGVMQNTPGFSTTQSFGKMGGEVAVPGPLFDTLNVREIEYGKSRIKDSTEAFENGLRGGS